MIYDIHMLSRWHQIPNWAHISEEETAKAMGHSLEVHRRNYQLWIDGDKQRRRLIDGFKHPY